MSFRDIITARCYASAVLAMDLCPSVSVTSQCSTKTAKRSITQTTNTIPQKLLFSDAKDLREIRPGTPPTRASNAGGVVRIGDFPQITGYISKTVKDRHIVSIKVEQEVICALSNGGTAHDLECPLTPHFLHFALPFIAS